MKINPLDPKYSKGYNDGFKAGQKATCKQFADGFGKLLSEKGIGKKTIMKMIKVMNLPMEENNEIL